MNEKHTPTPWSFRLHDDSDTADIRGLNDEEIALCVLTDAPTIIKAVNAHNDLVATVADLLKMTRLLERCLIYEIKKNEAEGDEEGARLKTITLNLVGNAIAKAEETQ